MDKKAIVKVLKVLAQDETAPLLDQAEMGARACAQGEEEIGEEIAMMRPIIYVQLLTRFMDQKILLDRTKRVDN